MGRERRALRPTLESVYGTTDTHMVSRTTSDDGRQTCSAGRGRSGFRLQDSSVLDRSTRGISRATLVPIGPKGTVTQTPHLGSQCALRRVAVDTTSRGKHP